MKGEEKRTPDYLSTMITVFDSLLKYVFNLIKPNRPSAWRSIKMKSAYFENRVDCMEGARDVLKLAGYSVEKTGSLEFPEHVREPDRLMLCELASELLLAKLNIEAMQAQRASSQSSPRKQQHVSLQHGRTGHMYSDTSRHDRVGGVGDGQGGGGTHFSQPIRAGAGNGTSLPPKTGGQPYNTLESQRYVNNQPNRAGGVNESLSPRTGEAYSMLESQRERGYHEESIRGGGVNALRGGGVNGGGPPLRAGGTYNTAEPQNQRGNFQEDGIPSSRGFEERAGSGYHPQENRPPVPARSHGNLAYTADMVDGRGPPHQQTP